MYKQYVYVREMPKLLVVLLYLVVLLLLYVCTRCHTRTKGAVDGPTF